MICTVVMYNAMCDNTPTHMELDTLIVTIFLQSTVLIPLQGKQVAAKKKRNGLLLSQESSDYKIILDSSC